MDRLRGGPGETQAAEAHPDAAGGGCGRGARADQLRGAGTLPLRVPRTRAPRR